MTQPGPNVLMFDCVTEELVTVSNDTAVNDRRYVSTRNICDTYVDCDNWGDEERDCGFIAIVPAYAGVLLLYLGLALLLATLMIFVWWKRKSKNVKKFSPVFLEIMMLGGMLGFCTVFPWIGRPTTAKCNVRGWTMALAFVFGWGSLFARTYRVRKLQLTGKSIQRVRVTDWEIGRIVLILFAVTMVLLILWSSIAPFYAVEKTVDGDLYYKHTECDADRKWIFLPIIFVYMGGLLLWGLYLARSLKQLKESQREYDESRAIYWAIGLWVAIGFFGLPLLFAPIFSTNRYAAFLVRHLFIAVGITGVMGLIIFPKALNYYREVWQKHKEHKEREREREREAEEKVAQEMQLVENLEKRQKFREREREIEERKLKGLPVEEDDVHIDVPTVSTTRVVQAVPFKPPKPTSTPLSPSLSLSLSPPPPSPPPPSTATATTSLSREVSLSLSSSSQALLSAEKTKKKKKERKREKSGERERESVAPPAAPVSNMNPLAAQSRIRLQQHERDSQTLQNIHRNSGDRR